MSLLTSWRNGAKDQSQLSQKGDQLMAYLPIEPAVPILWAQFSDRRHTIGKNWKHHGVTLAKKN